MTVGVLQPGYLPWLGFFEQLHKSDIFVIYDDVQYSKNSWRNRNKIKAANGAQWLTVPTIVRFEECPLINEVKIDNTSNWRKKHLFSIKSNYSKSKFYESYIGIFEEAYAKEWAFLVDIDMYFIEKLAECFGIAVDKIKRSSELKPQGGTIERIVHLCKMFRADIFYEGYSGKNYINEADFLKEGIQVIFQEYKHPVYPQLYGEFIPYLSAIDLLFNCGPQGLDILMNRLASDGKEENV